jgi:PAS domain S-box-containing protein
MGNSHEIDLSDAWPLLHTWPLPTLLPDSRELASAPTDLEQMPRLAGLGGWACDLRDNGLTWSAAVFDLFGVTRDMRIERPDAVAIYCEESREAMELLRSYAIRHQRGFTMDARLDRPDGTHRWMRLTTALVSENGRPRRLYGTKQDITFERARLERLKGAPDTDDLTGLATRAAFDARLFQARTGTLHPPGALLIIDAEKIEEIGRHFGAAAGEACLCALAERLAFRGEGSLMIARISDYGFAVLLHAASGRRMLDRKIKRLLRDIAEPVYWRGYLLHANPAIGIVYADGEMARDAEWLFSAALTQAQEARRRLRHAGHGRNALSLI